MIEITNPHFQRVWKDRYQKNNETLEEQLHRVANYIGSTEEEKQDFFNIMSEGLFFPAGRTMSNSNIGDVLTLNNCFTLNSIPDSMEGIMETAKIAALTSKAGGGVGYDFSLIRPNGTPTHNDAIATGPVSFMRIFNETIGSILQGR